MHMGQIGMVAAFFALIMSLTLTPLFRKLALKLGIVDSPNHRTIHAMSIPKLGGLGIFTAFFAGVLLAGWLNGGDSDFQILLMATAGIVLLGFVDDLVVLSCYRKLAIEILVAGLVIFYGFRIETITLPFGGTIDLGVWGIPLSMLWIIGLTNAINLLDGLDGLAAGFSIILGLEVMVLSFLTHNMALLSLSFIFVMATLGFLKYNFPPAKIFMGDTGSLFLGFCLACFSIKAFTLPGSSTNVASMVVAFALPLADTTLAITRRLSSGLHPFNADKKHIHHRLLEFGFRQITALRIILAATFITGCFAIILFLVGSEVAAFILILLGSVGGLALHLLGCFDFLTQREHVGHAGEL